MIRTPDGKLAILDFGNCLCCRSKKCFLFELQFFVDYRLDFCRPAVNFQGLCAPIFFNLT